MPKRLEMNIIAIDIGSTSIKCSTINLNTRSILHKSFYDTPEKEPNENELIYEIDVVKILSIVDSYLNTATSKFSIKNLYLTTQMHGYVYQSCQDSTYVSWQDKRSLSLVNNQTILSNIKNNVSSETINSTGIPIKHSAGIFNLYADSILNEHFDYFGEMYTLGSYIIKHLCNKNITHISSAAALGIVDIHNKCINSHLLKKLNLESITYPQIVTDTNFICGKVMINGQSLDIYPDFGDQQVSVLGANAEKNQYIFNLATAAQICIISGIPIRGAFEIRPYFDDKYLLTVTNLISGRNIEVISELLLNIVKQLTNKSLSVNEVFDKVILQDTSLTVEPSFFDVEGGSIINIFDNNFDLNNLISALFNSIIKQYKQVINVNYEDFKYTEGFFLGGVTSNNPYLVDSIAKNLSISKSTSQIEYDVFNGILKIALFNNNQINSIFDEVIINEKENL